MTFGIYALFMSPKYTANRLFFLICMSLAVWSMGFAFSTQAQDVHTSILWHRFAALGWASLYSFTLHFFLWITDRKQWLQNLGSIFCSICLP